MKAVIIQPHYSLDGQRDIDKCYNEMLALMDKCDESADIIVLPEYCHCQANMGNPGEAFKVKERLNDHFDQKARELAKRCKALVFANYGKKTDKGYLNVTFGINKDGETVAEYVKAHPAPSEVNDPFMDSDYSYEYRPPYVVEIDGLRYGFMTCYDFYFYESFAPLALQQVDIIIGCSHQRSDTHEALEIIGKFLAYNTNAYLLRSSISFSEDSPICGSSMAVAPDGTMLGNMRAKIGLLEVEFDPSKKYYKKAGFYGTKLQPHYEYLDQGRRPWLYRPGGPAMVPNDEFMRYPRVCAHRGFNTVAPENSMPAYGMAVALGADEIEFDIRLTKDGKLVSVHDNTLERVSDGTGLVEEHTLEELYKLDFGGKFGEKFKGLKILTFDDILKKFACQTVMNIHVKQRENFYDTPTDPKNKIYAEKIYAKLKQYDCVQYAYIMSVDDELHQILSEIAPELKRCMGAKPCKPWQIVDDAIKMKCNKVQLYAPYFNQEMIDKAHANGIMCNVFYTDDPSKAIEYIEMGIDTILTNDYLSVANAVKEWKKHNA